MSQAPVTGAEYVRQLSARESDRRTRAAFQRLALSLVPPGGMVFDFGAGTGTDARLYASSGLTVTAYDADPEMRGYFAEYCRELIASGHVRLMNGTYPQFLADVTGAERGGADLVTANFAPLNLVDNLPELFEKFHAVTSPRGRVLASVLSPYFFGDARYRWWWRNLAPLWLKGHYTVRGRHGPVIRRSLADFATRGLPYFTLQRVFPGLPGRPRHNDTALPSDNPGVDLRGGTRTAWLHTVRSLYMFLLFEKREATQFRDGAPAPSVRARSRR